MRDRTEAPPENEVAGAILADLQPAVARSFNNASDTEILLSLQAARLIRRFRLSMPVARITAELAFRVTP